MRQELKKGKAVAVRAVMPGLDVSTMSAVTRAIDAIGGGAGFGEDELKDVQLKSRNNWLCIVGRKQRPPKNCLAPTLKSDAEERATEIDKNGWYLAEIRVQGNDDPANWTYAPVTIRTWHSGSHFDDVEEEVDPADKTPFTPY